MGWKKVGEWVKGNAGTGAALVGSLLTGNAPGAIAAGVALVSSATGSTDPMQALNALQNDPATVVKLRELYYQNEESIRVHLATTMRLELEDAQAEHAQTQETVRAGDVAEDRFVRWTRPGQSWLSLLAAFAYVFETTEPDYAVLGFLLTLPWAYAGLRQVGKTVNAFASLKKAK